MKKQSQKKKADPDLWESQWQKRRFKWTRTHTYFAMFALAGVVLIGVIWWRLFSAGPESPQDLREDFTTFAFERMEEYKPQFALYDRLSDPDGLLQEDGWQTVNSAAQEPSQPVGQLLGEGCVLQSWEELKQAEADRLWKAWYVERQGNRMDAFIITELFLHIEHQTLPALQENTWLVYDPQGDKYILAHSNGTWGVKRMWNF